MSFLERLFGLEEKGLDLTALQNGFSPEPAVWTEEATDYVSDAQFKMYCEIAQAKGVKADPDALHAQLTRPVMPAENITLEKFKADLAAHAPPLTEQQWQDAFAGAKAQYDASVSVKLPTAYEDPNRYLVLKMIFDRLIDRMPAYGRGPRLPRPLFATIPSGNLSAEIRIEQETGAAVMMYARGLFGFLSGFAKLAAWAFPSVGVEEMSDDRLVLQQRMIYTMPLESSGYFISLLGTYVGNGDPDEAARAIPKPAHNGPLCDELLNLMETFIVAHELAHISLGHLESEAEGIDEHWRREYEADQLAFSVLARMSLERTGSWVMGAWGCYLALMALHFVDRGLAALAFGGGPVAWISRTHPSALERLHRFRPHAFAMVPAPRGKIRDAIGSRFNMSDNLLGRLWELSSWEFQFRHQQGVRPSPIWADWISRCMARRMD